MKTTLATAAALLAVLATPGYAQEQKPATPVISYISMRLQVVLSRYQGEKKISSLPYTLTVNTEETRRSAGRASLRLGAQVPIFTYARQTNEANAPLVPTVQYRDTGTSIDCIAYSMEDGRFRLDLTIEDSSLDTSGPGGAVEPRPQSMSSPTNPAFKSFRTSDQIILRDGQSTQYSTATDKLSGEVWKVDVTLNVVK